MVHPGFRCPGLGSFGLNWFLSTRCLVLFDIDGTLVRRAGSHHRGALVEAVRQCTGHSTSLDAVPTQGMLDGDLLLQLLAQTPLPESDVLRLLPELVKIAQQIYLSHGPDTLTDKVCPGVVPLLESLTGNGAVLALVTGNLTAIGWRKLELAGLRPFFALGAFAEEGSTRADLVRVALGKAESLHLLDEQTRVSLIGDHPNDVRAARAHQVQTVAVATGLSTVEELERESPDILVSDLTRLSAAQLL